MNRKELIAALDARGGGGLRLRAPWKGEGYYRVETDGSATVGYLTHVTKRWLAENGYLGPMVERYAFWPIMRPELWEKRERSAARMEAEDRESIADRRARALEAMDRKDARARAMLAVWGTNPF